ncbi:expressed protein [Phakopsora pachyrhizi]|uniref:Expressed protein n=1 Tax=Phakopsora pachyrhizi TaxID=170000 RepID=A0AAV0AJE6_PHAPC|nr:expressed protein [Phakopsora pachyrhizi]
MKLLAFIGDFFTPILSILLFFLSSLHYSLLHYSLLHYSASFPCNPISSLSCILCYSVLLSLFCPYPALVL